MLKNTRRGNRACGGKLEFGAGDIAGRCAGGWDAVALFALWLCLVLAIFHVVRFDCVLQEGEMDAVSGWW